MDTRLNRLRYSRTWQHRLGGVTFWLGRLTRDHARSPYVYAAALTEEDLRERHWRRGYGATEDAAIAALLSKTDN